MTRTVEVPRDGRHCDAFVLQSGSILSMLASEPARVFMTATDSVHFHPLRAGGGALRLATMNSRTFEIESLEGGMLDTPFEEVFLSTHAPFEVGAVFRGHGYRIEVCVLEGDRPRVIRITLEEAIESPRWRFLAWRDARFRHIELPKPGMSFVLDRCALDPLLP